MKATFTREVRAELAHHVEQRACCRLTEVAALVRTTGSFYIRGGASDAERYGLQLSTSLRSAAKLVYSHFKSFGVEGRLVLRREPRFQRRLIYEVHLDGSPVMLQALNELGVLSDSFRIEPGIPRRLLRNRCCRSAFLRGTLIGAGSLTAPQKEVHLEILTPHEDFARDLRQLVETLGFHPGVFVRRGVQVVYLKGREEVADLLAYAGAQEAALRVAEEAVVKEVRARANRLANCDQANMSRASAAAARQLEAIRLLERRGLLCAQPAALREVAELRRQYPYLSLTELAEAAPEGLSRSAVSHRLRRLVRTADKARVSTGSAQREGHRRG